MLQQKRTPGRNRVQMIRKNSFFPYSPFWFAISFVWNPTQKHTRNHHGFQHAMGEATAQTQRHARANQLTRQTAHTGTHQQKERSPWARPTNPSETCKGEGQASSDGATWCSPTENLSPPRDIPEQPTSFPDQTNREVCWPRASG